MKNILPIIYWAHKISLRKSAGQIERLSPLLAQSTIDLNPHQLHAALFAFNSPLSRGAILADEVGLGKTIEAGLVISQLWIEGKRRILLIVPASLRTQWKEELETHFNLPSTVLDTKYFDDQVNAGNPVPMTTEGIWIASLHFVIQRLALVEKQAWNVVIIDEAHRLRRVYRGRDASKMAYALRDAIREKPKLLLTATPLQNDLMELYGLVSFIDDKLLGSPYFFKTRFVDKIKGEVGSPDPVLQQVRELIIGSDSGTDFEQPKGVIVRTLRRQVQHYINFPPRRSYTIDFQPTDDEWQLYELVSSYLQRERIAAIGHSQRNLMILVYRKLLASSSHAIAPTLKKLADNLRRELELRKQESEQIETPSNEETDEAEQLELLEETEELEEAENKKKEKIRPDGFSDADIQEEIDDLDQYHSLAIKIRDNAKSHALVSAVGSIFKEAQKRSWPRKAVIFTESRRTQEYLAMLLRKSDLKVSIFNGVNDSREARAAYEQWKREYPESALHLSRDIAVRQALVHEFRNASEIFLTTEAGAEGLNLQFANIIINFDLPWNPQRVEQRIGRCHRYGQRYETLVVNMLNTRNYADKRLLQLLQEKLHLFEGVFGASDEILGAIGDGVDFQKQILDIYQNCKTPEEIDAAFEVLQKHYEPERTKELTDVRAQMIDQLDSPIMQLFKQTQKDVVASLSGYDQSLLRLCREYYGDALEETDNIGAYLLFADGRKSTYLFREEQEAEHGKYPRMHLEHPIIQAITKEALNLKTVPIPVVRFLYSAHKDRMRSLGSHVGKQGILYLFKIIVEGIETDEALIPMAFIHNGKDWMPLTSEEGTFLIELPSEATEGTLEKSPLPKEELLARWNEWKKQAVSKFELRNERLYVREQSRIERYWDSQTLQSQDKIEKLEAEIADLKRKKSNTVDFTHLRELAQKIQRTELKLQQLKMERLQLEADALKGKQNDFEELNRKLNLTKREELLAIASFTIV